MNDLQALTAVLEELNRAGSFKEVAGRLTAWARSFTHCQTAMLRLLETTGDPDGSWLAACAVDGHGVSFVRDEAVVDGTECICGRVATGTLGSDGPFVTEGGSFCWGRLSTLATSFSPDVLGPLRGRCVSERFESVAVFPVRAGEKAVGALHLADTRPDRFATSWPVVEAACRLAGDNLLRQRAQERERVVLETIETALLPAVPPQVEGLEVGVSFTSATEMAHVGGDFYDVLDLGEAGALVLVGDVSGKGVEAAGIAARARYVIEAQAGLSSDPASFLRAANDSLNRVLPAESFVTAAACLLDRVSGSMTVCLAGHPAPLVLTAADTTELDTPPNPPLGVVAGMRYREVIRHLAPGDILLVCTDGITEARRSDALFGGEGIRRVAATLPQRDPGSIARGVCSAAAEFHDTRLPGDDRLVVAVRLRESNESGIHGTG